MTDLDEVSLENKAIYSAMASDYYNLHGYVRAMAPSLIVFILFIYLGVTGPQENIVQKETFQIDPKGSSLLLKNYDVQKDFEMINIFISFHCKKGVLVDDKIDVNQKIALQFFKKSKRIGMKIIKLHQKIKITTTKETEQVPCLRSIWVSDTILNTLLFSLG